MPSVVSTTLAWRYRMSLRNSVFIFQFPIGEVRPWSDDLYHSDSVSREYLMTEDMKFRTAIINTNVKMFSQNVS